MCVCVCVGERAGVVFADMLTQTLEVVAAVLDKYSAIVKSCYGDDYLLPFMKQIQV